MRRGVAGRPPLAGIVLEMLWEHRWAYAGLAILLIAASALVGASFLLMAGAGAAADAVDTAGMTRNEAARLLQSLDDGRIMGGYLAALGAFVAVLLVSQTMSFVVEGRRRELALLRLAGATPRQVTGIVLAESAVLGLLCSILGSLLSLALTGPYTELLVRSGNWPPGVQVDLRPGALAWCVAAMTLVAVVGAYGAARRIGRAAPVEAVRHVASARRRMPPARWVLAGLGLAVVAVFLTIPAGGVSYPGAILPLGAGAVLLVTALVPVLVPLVAGTFGRLLSLAAPGAGLVARERTAHAERRATALATPIVVVLGLGAVFGMLAQTGRAEAGQGLRELTHVGAVAEASGSDAGDEALEAARRAPEAASITRVQRTESWSWAEDSMPRESLLQLMGVEPATAERFIPLEFDAGSIEDVRGTDVAAITGSAQLGEILHLESPDGNRTAVRVVATVAEPTSFIKGDLLVDQTGLQLGAGDTEDTWLAEPAAGTTDEELAGALEEAASSARTATFEEWAEDGVSRSVAEQRVAILMLLGGAGLLAACALAQSTLTSVRERREEFRLLARIGASRRSVLGSIIGESAIIAAAAAILAVGVVALVRFRMGAVLEAQGSGVPALMPYGILALVLLACVAVSIGSAALGGTLALLRRAGGAEE